MQKFLDILSEEEKNSAKEFIEIVSRRDSAVEMKEGGVMGSNNGVAFEQEGVFKYGLVKTKTGFSFHTMAMYANPELRDYLKENSKGLKIQKGCVNFKSFVKFPTELFEEFIKLSAEKDFTPVVDHYKKKKK